MGLAQPRTEAEHDIVREVYIKTGVRAAIESDGFWIGQTRHSWHWINGIGVLAVYISFYLKINFKAVYSDA